MVWMCMCVFKKKWQSMQRENYKRDPVMCFDPENMCTVLYIICTKY